MLKKILSFAIVMSIVLSVFLIPGGVVASAAHETKNDAIAAAFDEKYTGTITSTDKKDYYKIVLEEAGKLTINMTVFCDLYYGVSGQDGMAILNRSISTAYTGVNFKNEVRSLHLTAGTYYFEFHRWDQNGEYNVTFSFKSANETIKESYRGSNESLNTASEIPLNEQYYGQIAQNESFDYYKFTLNEKRKVTLKFHTDDMAWVLLFNSNGAQLYAKDCINNDYTATGDDIKEIELDTGTYYYCVRSTNGVYANYSLIVICEEELPEVYYAINYEPNGGKVSSSIVSVKEGDSVILPTPTKNGKIIYNLNGGIGENYEMYSVTPCIGWSETNSENSSIYLCGSSYYPSADVTLFAIWDETPHTVLSEIPEREGYTFVGWSENPLATEAEYSAGDVYESSEDATLYAVWEADEEDTFSLFGWLIDFIMMIIDLLLSIF